MKRTSLLLALCIAGAASLIAATGCKDPLEACGKCGKVSTGDTTISGDARLDGFFKAVGTLGSATASIDADFRGEVEALAEAFGSACAADDAATPCAELSIGDLVAEVKGSIETEIDTQTSAGISVKYEPPKCSANVSVAVEAQAQCEAKADCDVSAECSAGEVAVNCSGQCSGTCDGTCDGELKCEASASVSGTCEGDCSGSCMVTGPAVACEGTCSGTCTVEADMECSGTCDGNCTGTCDGEAVEGVACDGICEGECSAECHIQGSATCEGTCNGECEYTPAEAQCEGTCKGECMAEVDTDGTCSGEPPHCEGSCEGTCSAECTGTVTPPACSAEGSCEASADCQASASAQASASMECTPPSLEIDFKLAVGLDAQAKAEFLAKMEELGVRMVAIAQGMVKLRLLVDADYAASLDIDSPVAIMEAQIDGFVDAGIGDFDVPVGLLPCVIPAFEETLDILDSLINDTTATISGQRRRTREDTRRDIRRRAAARLRGLVRIGGCARRPRARGRPARAQARRGRPEGGQPAAGQPAQGRPEQDQLRQG
jgi:hypothetical protein